MFLVAVGIAVLAMSTVCICSVRAVCGRKHPLTGCGGDHSTRHGCRCIPVSHRRRFGTVRGRRSKPEEPTPTGRVVRPPCSFVGEECDSDDAGFIWNEYYNGVGDEELHNLSSYSAK